jgi:putative selenate reductase
MPEETMYLSGPPLHVLATALLNRLLEARPHSLMIPGHDGKIQVSFSAGITKENLVDSIAMGVRPATICSDLLKPGGYGRLAPMLKVLAEAVRKSGAGDLEGWRQGRLATATAAGHRDLVAEHLTAVLGEDRQRYELGGNEKLPRSVDHELEMWGCVACNFCVTVCPNDAFFKLPTQGVDGLEGRQQYFVFTELCNDCGNCMTFCPEDGDPAQIKPRLFTDRSRFEAADGPRFLIDAGATVGATPAGAADGEVPTLLALLNSPEGLPLQAT